MSRLEQLKHLRLLDCFDECTDHSLGAALVTLTGDVHTREPANKSSAYQN